MDTNEQVTVFHPLNGSGAKGTTGRSNAGRRKQKDILKAFTRGILYQHNTNARLYRTSPRFPPVSLFFFGVQNRFLFCLQKKKRFWPQPGRQKNNRKVKHPAFPQKKKRFSPQGLRPIHKATQSGNIRPPLPNPHPGGVDINEQGAVFHPLNGSGAKGTTGRSNAGRRKQKDILKAFTRGTTSQHR